MCLKTSNIAAFDSPAVLFFLCLKLHLLFWFQRGRYVGESALFITGARFELGLIPAFDLDYNYSALRFLFDTFGSW